MSTALRVNEFLLTGTGLSDAAVLVLAVALGLNEKDPYRFQLECLPLGHSQISSAWKEIEKSGLATVHHPAIKTRSGIKTRTKLRNIDPRLLESSYALVPPQSFAGLTG